MPASRGVVCKSHEISLKVAFSTLIHRARKMQARELVERLMDYQEIVCDRTHVDAISERPGVCFTVKG